MTLKGRSKGQELRWSDLVNGEAALAVALNASVGTFESPAIPRARAAASAAQKSTRGRAAAGGRTKSKRITRPARG